MRLPKSILGLLLIGIYLIAGAIFYFSTQNNEGWSGVIFLSTFFFPWIYFVGPIAGRLLFEYGPSSRNVIFPILYILMVILNSFILYWIGVGIQKLFSKIK